MERSQKRFPFIPFIINLLIPLIYGAVAAAFRSSISSDWYTNLEKPIVHLAFTASGATRSILSFIIGFAAFLIWRRRKSIVHYKKVIFFYFASLTVNTLWAWTFFSMQSLPVAALITIPLLICSSTTIVLFYRVNRLAAALIFFYLIWTLLISYNTIAAYILNT